MSGIPEFDPTAPLPGGTTVLEASAGTGKTHALADLAVRLIAAGAGTIDRLLLVTFSRNATRELRARVRSHLLLATAAAAPGEARGRLEAAVAGFDAARVMTIHEFCAAMYPQLGILASADPSGSVLSDLTPLVRDVAGDLYVSRYAFDVREPPFPFQDDKQRGVVSSGALRLAADAVSFALRPIEPCDAEGSVAQRVDFAQQVREVAAERRRQLGVLTFDDQLVRLRDTLADPITGSASRERLRARFDAVLVDEFQDTDPVQWQILRLLFDGHRRLVLIGDPKQAIYAFLGADIFTYIRARHDTPEANRSTMATNFRSTPAMVDAVNILFGRRQDAFIFHADIPFHPVQATPNRAQPLLVDGQSASPLNALLLDSSRLAVGPGKAINKDKATQASAAFCADEIRTLLELAAAGRAKLGDRALTAGDIAILAPTHTTAEAMRQALRIRGLQSVSLLQQSVFATDEARQLTLVLTALLDLSDATGVRAGLATDLFGLDAAHLHAFKEGDAGWQAQLEQLAGYQRLWRDHGFLAMFHQLLAEQRVTLRLTARTEGTRALTNYLHLAELLQESPAARHGMAGLLRWLRQQRQAPGDKVESQLIRLEDDEQLIRIVTIHRAKGLEFPVVALPFLWAVREPQKNDLMLFHDRKSARLILDLGTGNEEHQALQREEALAEHLRLLYVAVTRAKSCCLLCWGRVNGMERTGLAHLLHAGRRPADDTELLADLDRLDLTRRILACKTMPETFSQTRMATPSPTVTLAARTFAGRIPIGWGMTSYSRLIAGAATDRDHDQQAATRPLAAPTDFDDIFCFPRGPAAGTCLHTLLERLDPTRPATAQEELVRTTLTLAGIDLRWLPATLGWLDDLLAVPIADGCRLCDLGPRHRISELAFFFPLEHLDLQSFNGLLASFGHAPLPAGTTGLQGLMKGFIDLVFRHQGRYYLADYKSNHLGPDLDHYGPERLQASMREHRYALQYLIYTLALHRYLRQRVADYHYETHFGGVRYLFLRAMSPGNPPGSGIIAARPEFLLIDGLDRCCRGREVG